MSKKRSRNCLCKYYIYNRVTTEISQKHEKSIDFSILVYNYFIKFTYNTFSKRGTFCYSHIPICYPQHTYHVALNTFNYVIISFSCVRFRRDGSFCLTEYKFNCHFISEAETKVNINITKVNIKLWLILKLRLILTQLRLILT